MTERCNICDRPATGLWGCGPRCGKHQYDEGPTLAELRRQRDSLELEIFRREADALASVVGTKNETETPNG